MPYLAQKNADGSPVKQWDLQDKPLTVGRSDGVDVKIDDAELSRHHFTIAPKGGVYILQDNNSTNGTHVNGKQVVEIILKPNDKIRVGQTHFVFIEGLKTVIGHLEKAPEGYSTYIRNISSKDKPS